MLDETRDKKLPAPRPEVIAAIKAGLALPILDLGPFLAGEPGAKEHLAADIAVIQESLGFYAIANHGIDPALIEAATEQSFKAFALPEETLNHYKKEGHMQGYWPANTIANVRPGYEKDHEKVRDIPLALGWAFLRDREAGDPKVTGNMRHRTMNKWPDPSLLPEFRPIVSRYHRELLDLGLKLVPIYAIALGLPENYFDKDFVNPEWYSRINFTHGTPTPGPDSFVATAHSDHSFLTLLPIASVPGLQIRTPAQTWMDIPYDRGTIVINTGEWLNHLSNGRFLATPHRVLTPNRPRVSMPVFIDPNDEATDQPVPGALKSGEKAKWPVSSWHKHFCSYIDGYTKAQ